MYYWYKESCLKTFDPEDKYMKRDFDAQIGMALVWVRLYVEEGRDLQLKKWRETLGNQIIDELIRFCREDGAEVR
jgi:hypothetical protein